MSTVPFIIYILSAMHLVLFGVAGGWMLYNHDGQRDRSRLIVGTAFLCILLGCLIFLLTGLFRGNLPDFMNTIMEPYPLIISFLFVQFWPVYLLEIQRPHWLTVKRGLLILSPWMIMSAAWLMYHGMHGWGNDAITHLTHYSQIMPNIHQPNVMLRVLMTAIFVPYAVAILFIRTNWRTSNLSARQLKILQGLIVLCIFAYIFGVLLRIHWIFIAYFLLLDTLSLCIIFLEHHARIPVPVIQEIEPVVQPIAPVAADLSPLAQRLQQQLALGIWQNPDLDRNDVCRLLGTNYTYLVSAIHELGYNGFPAMINKHRAQYVHDELLKNPKTNLSDLFFRAGYRSRSTAINYFKQVYHSTPADFIKG